MDLTKSVYASVEVTDLPSLDHLGYRDFDEIYEPAEDTYLFIDVLRAETDFLHSINPSIVVEIGYAHTQYYIPLFNQMSDYMGGFTF